MSSSQNITDYKVHTYVDRLGYNNLPIQFKRQLYIWHRMGYGLVSPKYYQHRLSVCRGCMWWKETQSRMECTKCKCNNTKLLLKTSSCPLSEPKW